MRRGGRAPVAGDPRRHTRVFPVRGRVFPLPGAGCAGHSGTTTAPRGGAHDRNPRTHQALRPDARRRRPVLHHPSRPGHRLPRPERRRQVDDHAHDPRAGPADLGAGADQRQALPGPQPSTADGRRAAGREVGAPQQIRAVTPALAGPVEPAASGPGGRGARPGRPDRGRRPPGRRLLAGHVPAARHRRRAAGRPGDPAVRRAGQRAGPGGHRVDPRVHAAPGGRGAQCPGVQPPAAGDGAHRDRAGGDRARPADRAELDRRVRRRAPPARRCGCAARSCWSWRKS